MTRKPRALKPGDVIGVAAPAGPVDEERLRLGVAELERIGFVVRLGEGILERRAFTAGAATLFSAPAALAAPATRQVETSLGRIDIPAAPQRVVAIDSRIGLEQALAFDLPLVGYSHSRARPWVPVPPSVPPLLTA